MSSYSDVAKKIFLHQPLDVCGSKAPVPFLVEYCFQAKTTLLSQSLTWNGGRVRTGRSKPIYRRSPGR